jgi:hypothetical protein
MHAHQAVAVAEVHHTRDRGRCVTTAWGLRSHTALTTSDPIPVGSAAGCGAPSPLGAYGEDYSCP